MSQEFSQRAAVTVRDLKLALPAGGDRPHAVDGVSFDLTAGKILCIVGESGSGKSMCAHALMGLLPDTVIAEAGEISFGGQNLLTLDQESWLGLRGRRIAMVFQEPMTALNPVMRIGDQIAEVFEAHGLLTPKERKQKAVSLLREVGLPDPERSVRAYPHQLSGGQRQRVMIAMALALEPAVLVADEPTTALDVTTQAQILKLIRDLQRRRNMAVLFITHDFGVVAEIADRVVVIQHGKVVEQGAADDVLVAPATCLYPRAARRRSNHAAAATRGTARSAQGGRGDRSRKNLCQRRRLVSARRAACRRRRKSASTFFRARRSAWSANPVPGKSSVARLVMRLIEPDRGTVRLGDTDLTPDQRQGVARAAPPHPDGVPGSVRLAQSAPQGRQHHHRWPDRAWRRSGGCATARPRSAGSGGPQRQRHGALSARILRRPAAAHRDRPGAGARPRDPGRR